MLGCFKLGKTLSQLPIEKNSSWVPHLCFELHGLLLDHRIEFTNYTLYRGANNYFFGQRLEDGASYPVQHPSMQNHLLFITRWALIEVYSNCCQNNLPFKSSQMEREKKRFRRNDFPKFCLCINLILLYGLELFKHVKYLTWILMRVLWAVTVFCKALSNTASVVKDTGVPALAEKEHSDVQFLSQYNSRCGWSNSQLHIWSL